MKENILSGISTSSTNGLFNLTGTNTTTSNLQYINQYPNGYKMQTTDMGEILQEMLGATPKKKPTNLVEKIDEILLDMAVMDSELELQAIKHLNYAKAYLEKRTLDVLNKKNNGDSKPD